MNEGTRFLNDNWDYYSMVVSDNNDPINQHKFRPNRETNQSSNFNMVIIGHIVTKLSTAECVTVRGAHGGGDSRSGYMIYNIIIYVKATSQRHLDM